MTNNKTAAFSVGGVFHDGMTRYALKKHDAAMTLSRLAAFTALGICVGVFCFFLWGEGADTGLLAAEYVRRRAWSSFADAAAYTAFFCDWFCHHAWWILFVIPLALTVYPFAALSLLCVLRGMTSGFSVCSLSGGFSVFGIAYAAMQGALCALLVMAAAKGVLYAGRRSALPRGSHRQFSLPFLCGDTAPFLCGVLFALSAQGIGMLIISGICCIL